MCNDPATRESTEVFVSVPMLYRQPSVIHMNGFAGDVLFEKNLQIGGGKSQI